MSTNKRSTHATEIADFLAKRNFPVDGLNLNPKLANALQLSPSIPAQIEREIKVETLTATTPAHTQITLIRGVQVACNRKATHLYLSNLFNGHTLSELDIETLNTSQTYAFPGLNPTTEAFSLDDNLIYLTYPSSDKLWLIDLLTQKLVESASLDKLKTDLFLTPDGKNLLYIGGSPNHGFLRVIDASTQQLVTTVPTETFPWTLTTNSHGSLAYVACWTAEGSTEFSVIQTFDTTTWQLTNSLKLRGSVFAMVTNPRNNHLYVTNYTGNEFIVVDTNSNEIITTIPTAHRAENLCVSPDGKYVYVQTAERIIAVIDTGTLQTVEKIDTTKSILTSITVSPKTGDIFVAYA